MHASWLHACTLITARFTLTNTGQVLLSFSTGFAPWEASLHCVPYNCGVMWCQDAELKLGKIAWQDIS